MPKAETTETPQPNSAAEVDSRVTSAISDVECIGRRRYCTYTRLQTFIPVHKDGSSWTYFNHTPCNIEFQMSAIE